MISREYISAGGAAHAAFGEPFHRWTFGRFARGKSVDDWGGGESMEEEKVEGKEWVW